MSKEKQTNETGAAPVKKGYTINVVEGEALTLTPNERNLILLMRNCEVNRHNITRGVNLHKMEDLAHVQKGLTVLKDAIFTVLAEHDAYWLNQEDAQAIVQLTDFVNSWRMA